MFGLFKKRQAESQSQSYTQRVLAAQATGNVRDLTIGSVHSALVTVANLVERSALGATIDVPERFSKTVTPSYIAHTLRDLVMAGDSLSVIQVNDGAVELRRASNWTITSAVGASESAWMYRATLAAPGGSIERTSVSSGVVHVRTGTDSTEPWLGRNPLYASKAFEIATRRLEAYLCYELNTPTAKLIPVPASSSAYETADGNVVDPMAELKESLENLRGGIALPESFANAGEGHSNSYRKEWEPTALRPEPYATFNGLLAEISKSVFAACGVPSSLFQAGAASTRESMRAFVVSTLQPMTAAIVAELALKLETPVGVSYDGIMTSDVAAKARALKALVESGVSLQSAGTAVGLNVEAGATT